MGRRSWSVTEGLPRVRVPVLRESEPVKDDVRMGKNRGTLGQNDGREKTDLSKTTVSTLVAAWKAVPPPWARIPFWAARPSPTAAAVGAASPMPQGQATTALGGEGRIRRSAENERSRAEQRLTKDGDEELEREEDAISRGRVVALAQRGVGERPREGEREPDDQDENRNVDLHKSIKVGQPDFAQDRARCRCEATHHDRHKHARHLLRQHFHRTLLPLGLPNSPHNLFNHRLLSQPLHAHDDRARQVDRPREDLVPRPLLDRFGLAREGRLVKRRRAGDDCTVARRKGPRLNENEIGEVEVGCGKGDGGKRAESRGRRR